MPRSLPGRDKARAVLILCKGTPPSKARNVLSLESSAAVSLLHLVYTNTTALSNHRGNVERHHESVLAIVRVVGRAHPLYHEPQASIQPLGCFIGTAHFKRDPPQ